MFSQLKTIIYDSAYFIRDQYSNITVDIENIFITWQAFNQCIQVPQGHLYQ